MSISVWSEPVTARPSLTEQSWPTMPVVIHVIEALGSESGPATAALSVIGDISRSHPRC